MTCKEMVILYYKSSFDARTDCDALGIDRRRVKNLVRQSNKKSYSEKTGHWADYKNRIPITTLLRVDANLVDQHIEDLNSVDNESYC